MKINNKEAYKEARDTITMNNLKLLLKKRGYTNVKVSMNVGLSEHTIAAYLDGQKIPSLPTLISLANFLSCNIDFLLDRTDNPVEVDKLELLSKDVRINNLLHDITSLPKDKLELVEAFVKGIYAGLK